MINDFILFMESKELVTASEKNEIKKILNEYVNQGYSKEFNFKYNLIAKKMDESRRVFSVDWKDKIILQYINYIIKKSCYPRITAVSCNNIIKKIQDNSKDFKYLKITDLSKYFDRIDRNELLRIIKEKIDDVTVQKNIENVLINVFNAMDKCNEIILKKEFSSKSNIEKSGIKIGKGIPQGIPIANILSIIYLDDLRLKNSYTFRYIDDIFILSNNKSFKSIRVELQKHNLVLNTSKTKCVSLKDGIVTDYRGETITNNQKLNILGYSTFVENNKLYTSPSFKSFNRQFRLLNEIKQEYKMSPTRKEYLEYKLNLQICGHFSGNKQMGWVHYYQSINDISKLKVLDNWVKKNFPDFDNVKTYIRTYHCIRNLNDCNQKNAKKNLKYLTENTSIDVLTISEKKRILNSYYGGEHQIDENQIIERFKKIYFNNVSRLEEDFGRKS